MPSNNTYPTSWPNIAGAPLLTVSAVGLAAGYPLPNNGCNYGPDTPGTSTGGQAEANSKLTLLGGGLALLVDGQTLVITPSAGNAFTTPYALGSAVSSTEWSNVSGGPFVTVSSVGTAHGYPVNDGANFGPDTAGTSTVGIQEASTTSSTVFVRPGTYVLGDLVALVNNNFQIVLDPQAIVTIPASPSWSVTTNGSGVLMSPVFEVNDCSNVEITGGQLVQATPSSSTQGCGVHVGPNASSVYVHHVVFQNLTRWPIFVNGYTNGTAGVWSFFYEWGNYMLDCGTSSIPDGGGVRIANDTGTSSVCHHAYLGVNTQIISPAYAGYDLNKNTTGPVQHVYIRDAYLSGLTSTGYGINLENVNSASPGYSTGCAVVRVDRVHVTGFYIPVILGANYFDVEFTDVTATYGWLQGFKLAFTGTNSGLATRHVRLARCTAANNNQAAASATGFMLGFDAGLSGYTLDDVSLDDCLSYDSQATPTQQYGLLVENVTSGATLSNVTVRRFSGVQNGTGAITLNQPYTGTVTTLHIDPSDVFGKVAGQIATTTSRNGRWTVNSTVGIALANSSVPNGGYDFGPDSLGLGLSPLTPSGVATTTGGLQEMFDFVLSLGGGTTENVGPAGNYTSPIAITGQVALRAGVNYYGNHVWYRNGSAGGVGAGDVAMSLITDPNGAEDTFWFDVCISSTSVFGAGRNDVALSPPTGPTTYDYVNASSIYQVVVVGSLTGTVTGISINGTSTGQTYGSFIVNPGGTLAVTYSSSAAPTMAVLGGNVNVIGTEDCLMSFRQNGAYGWGYNFLACTGLAGTFLQKNANLKVDYLMDVDNSDTMNGVRFLGSTGGAQAPTNMTVGQIKLYGIGTASTVGYAVDFQAKSDHVWIGRVYFSMAGTAAVGSAGIMFNDGKYYSSTVEQNVNGHVIDYVEPIATPGGGCWLVYTNYAGGAAQDEMNVVRHLTGGNPYTSLLGGGPVGVANGGRINVTWQNVTTGATETTWVDATTGVTHYSTPVPMQWVNGNLVQADNRSGLTSPDGSPINLLSTPPKANTCFLLDIVATLSAWTSGSVQYTLSWTDWNGATVTLTLPSALAALHATGGAHIMAFVQANAQITAQMTGTFSATVTLRARVAEDMPAAT